MAKHRRAAEGHEHTAGFREGLELRHGPGDRDATQLIAIFRGDLGRRGRAAAEAATTAVRFRNTTIGKQDHVELRLQVAGIKRRREDAFEVELELFE